MAWPVGKDRIHPRFKREVCEQSYVLGSFLTLGQLREYQKAFPSASWEHTLDTHSEGIQITARDTLGAYRTNGIHPSVNQESERDDNAHCIDPTRHGEWNRGLDLSGPLRKHQQVDGGKRIDAIHGQGNNEEKPEPEVREGGETGLRLEIVDILDSMISCDCHKQFFFGFNLPHSPISPPWTPGPFLVERNKTYCGLRRGLDQPGR